MIGWVETPVGHVPDDQLAGVEPLLGVLDGVFGGFGVLDRLAHEAD